ncbi:MAG: hypothetical protein WEB03_01245 [Nitriliruptor sp.]|uniref:hypothetical protein n=1 Tax=Nitriliruptor sp. TaxID=2448056 RepID=UPI0034A0609F
MAVGAGQGDEHVILVVANRTLASPVIEDALAHRAAERGDVRFRVHLVVPATPVVGPLSGWVEAEHIPARASEDPGFALARHRLRSGADRLRDLGFEVDGEVGDPDPFVAVGQVLRRTRVDEIVVSTFASSRSSWARSDLVRRLQRHHGLPTARLETALDEVEQPRAAARRLHG